MDPSDTDPSDATSPAQSPRHHVYFVTVEWHDEPHQPESPERLAQLLRQAIIHDHDHGPQMPSSRFTVRVKADDAAAEVSGTVEHHHHHHQPAPGSSPSPE